MVRLRRVGRSDLTLTRRRSGKGFTFLDASGAVIRDAAVRQRIAALGIPPAWTDVRIAAHERAHIQALGVDEAGRTQYIYHAEWETRRTGRKQQRLAQLTAALPRIRRRVAAELSGPEGSRTFALALAEALIDRTAMRVGRERYLETNGTRGAGTLFTRDVTVRDGKLQLKFSAKGSKKAEYLVADPLLVDAVTRIKTLPGKRLLVYRDDYGKVRPINTAAINAWLCQVAGCDISAKDFRTLHASALAAEALAALELGTSETARKRQIAGVVREISQVLRNTPAICRKSYIAPCLFRLFDEGKLQGVWETAGRAGPGIKLRERRLAAVLAAA